MKFYLIDKVEELSERRLIGVKYVSLAEEYLADHFPTYPVLPGVMMLEAMVQAAGWLMHQRTDFACSMAVLKEAQNVKYGQFIAPGDTLRVEVECVSASDSAGTFKATGSVAGKVAVAAKLELAYFNLGDRQPELAELDGRLIEHHRSRWALIDPRAAAAIATATTGTGVAAR